MSRMSAKYVATKVGMSTKWVYEMWVKMGLVTSDGIGGYDLTKLGRDIGGRLSESNYPVPVFPFEKIDQLMIDCYNKTKK